MDGPALALRGEKSDGSRCEEPSGAVIATAFVGVLFVRNTASYNGGGVFFMQLKFVQFFSISFFVNSWHKKIYTFSRLCWSVTFRSGIVVVGRDRPLDALTTLMHRPS